MTLALPGGLSLFPHRAFLANKASLGKLVYRDQRYWLQAQWVVSGKERAQVESWRQKLQGARNWRGFLLYLRLHLTPQGLARKRAISAHTEGKFCDPQVG